MKIQIKAGQAEIESVGRTGLKGMIASGRQTAPPQFQSEVVVVTKSACQAPCEAAPVFPIAFEFSWIASGSEVTQRQVASSSGSHLHSVYTASISHILFDPPGRGA